MELKELKDKDFDIALELYVEKRKEFKKSFFKPIIIQTVVCREVFRKDIEVEEAPFDYRYVDDIYAKLIKY